MSSNYREATILGTHVRALKSVIVGQEYELSVLLPESYASSQARYPVLYLLDGNVQMANAGTLVPLLYSWDRVIPELIVIGVGYPIHTLDEWYTHRNRDYFPTAIPDLPVVWGHGFLGGGARFYRFLSEELIPFVDAEYRTDPTDRTVYGYSGSGFFAIYALFQSPVLFQRYIAGSPSLWYDNRVILNCESEYARSHTALPARFFMEVGSLEHNENEEEDGHFAAIQDFAATLRSRNYAGLDFTFAVLEGETHVSAGSRPFVDGLKTVFA